MAIEGNIGSGKSTFLNYFQQFPIVEVDASSKIFVVVDSTGMKCMLVVLLSSCKKALCMGNCDFLHYCLGL